MIAFPAVMFPHRVLVRPQSYAVGPQGSDLPSDAASIPSPANVQRGHSRTNERRELQQDKPQSVEYFDAYSPADLMVKTDDHLTWLACPANGNSDRDLLVMGPSFLVDDGSGVLFLTECFRVA